MGLPNEAIEETEPVQGPVRYRYLAESGQIAAGTNQRDNASTGSWSTAKKDDGHDEEDSSSTSLVTTSMQLIRSDPSDQEVVQEEATSDAIPVGWTRTKLEPDW